MILVIFLFFFNFPIKKGIIRMVFGIIQIYLLHNRTSRLYYILLMVRDAVVLDSARRHRMAVREIRDRIFDTLAG